jgi:putative transposase
LLGIPRGNYNGEMVYQRRTRRRRAYNEPGHAHELTFSCYHGYRFLERDRTCLWLAEAIDSARDALEFSLWAYVVMPEHVHLLVWPRRSPYDISEILKKIKNPVGRKAVSWLRREAPEWLDRIREKRGAKYEYHFWQAGGGYDRNITEPSTLGKAIDYLHENPLRRGLVERAADWKWSSASWFEQDGKNVLKPDPIPPEWTEGINGA